MSTPTQQSVVGTGIAYRRLLTVEEAADMLGMGRTAIFDQMRQGRLKSVKVGRARRIPTDCIDDFVDLLKTEAETEDAA